MLENSIVSLARFISRAKTKDGKTLIEKTAYKDIAMWWFVDAYFYKFLEQLVKLISPIKDSNTPSLMENRKNFLSRKIRHTPLYNIGFIHALYNFLTALLCQLIIKSHKLSTVSPKKPKILLTAENIEWREIQDFSTKKKRKSDAFFDSLILMLRRDKRY